MNRSRLLTVSLLLAALGPSLRAMDPASTPKNLPGLDLSDAAAIARRTAIHGEPSLPNIADARNRPGKKSELYDLQRDPWEKNDLAARLPERVQHLPRNLDVWRTAPADDK